MRGRGVEVLEDWTPEALRRRLQEGGVDEVVVGPVVPRERVPAAAARLRRRRCARAGRGGAARPGAASASGRAHRLQRVPVLPAHGARPPGAAGQGGDRSRAAPPSGSCCPRRCSWRRPWPSSWVRAGPCFFIQQRGGLNGHPFPMLKFRTMREGAEAERDGAAGRQRDGRTRLQDRATIRGSPASARSCGGPASTSCRSSSTSCSAR